MGNKNSYESYVYNFWWISSTLGYYLREGISVRFPTRFCETCWIEDGEVAEWVQETWDSVVATVKFWVGLYKSKQPRNNNSYDTLPTHDQDLLMPAKVHFFYICCWCFKAVFSAISKWETCVMIHVSLVSR